MVAVMVVGIADGPVALDRFHDGIATTFAVLVVLLAVAVFVVGVQPRAGARSGRDGG